MKKIILSIIALALSVSAFSQSSTLPRYGTTKNDDNTGRVFTYGYIAPVVTSTSLNITGAALNYNATLLNLSTIPASLATLTVAITQNNRSFVGDEIQVVGFMATTTSITWRTPSVASIPGFFAGSVSTVSGNNRQFNINFRYDGSNFVETGRFNR